MKLLTNKQFQRVLEKAIKPFKENIDELNKKINDKEFKYLEECSSLRDINSTLEEKLDKALKELNDEKKENNAVTKIVSDREEEIQKLENEKNLLKIKCRKSNSANGGLIKQINKLQAKLDEANIKLSQRYILKELAPQKAKNMQVMKTKSNAIQSKIIKKVVEDNE